MFQELFEFCYRGNDKPIQVSWFWKINMALYVIRDLQLRIKETVLIQKP